MNKASMYSIFHLKCPRCHGGDLYAERNPYKLNKTLKMFGKCSVCGQDFQFEPGFYSAALWISYPFVVILTILICIILIMVFKLAITFSLIIAAIVLVMLQPPIMRFSRAILLNNFVEYDPKFAQRNK